MIVASLDLIGKRQDNYWNANNKYIFCFFESNNLSDSYTLSVTFIQNAVQNSPFKFEADHSKKQNIFIMVSLIYVKMRIILNDLW
jgi:hypothetical protein